MAAQGAASGTRSARSAITVEPVLVHAPVGITFGRGTRALTYPCIWPNHVSGYGGVRDVHRLLETGTPKGQEAEPWTGNVM